MSSFSDAQSESNSKSSLLSGVQSKIAGELLRQKIENMKQDHNQDLEGLNTRLSKVQSAGNSPMKEISPSKVAFELQSEGIVFEEKKVE